MILKDVGKSLDLDLGGVGVGVEVGGSSTGGVSSSAGAVGLESAGLGVTDTLASMLSRTTSLLPDALFASLGMPRAGESIREAQHVCRSDFGFSLIN
jgi:hypothetical protein